jgi:hypothetical protein
VTTRTSFGSQDEDHIDSQREHIPTVMLWEDWNNLQQLNPYKLQQLQVSLLPIALPIVGRWLLLARNQFHDNMSFEEEECLSQQNRWAFHIYEVSDKSPQWQMRSSVELSIPFNIRFTLSNKACINITCIKLGASVCSLCHVWK